MVKVVAYDDVKSGRECRQGTGGQMWRTFFMRPRQAGVPRDPYVILSEGTPRRVLVTHFHRVDQFQVVVGGDGFMGRHKLAPNAVHFARANTAYGPLAGGEQGISFITLRSMGDPTGRHHLPQATDELLGIPNRAPWQATEMAAFDPGGGIAIREFEKIKDDGGLGAFALRLAAGERAHAPDPSHGDGQFVVVTKGSLIYEGVEKKAITIAFLTPEEAPFELQAGEEGLEALVLNFPRPRWNVAIGSRTAATIDK